MILTSSGLLDRIEFSRIDATRKYGRTLPLFLGTNLGVREVKEAIKRINLGAEVYTLEKYYIIELLNTPDDPEASIARARVAPGVHYTMALGRWDNRALCHPRRQRTS